MALTLKHIAADRRTLPVTIGAETLTVVYRPSVITPNLEAELLRVEEVGSSYVELLLKVLESWDLREYDDGPIVPLDRDTLGELPLAIIAEIAAAIANDQEPAGGKA